jgi:hypothetical protein
MICQTKDRFEPAELQPSVLFDETPKTVRKQ